MNSSKTGGVITSCIWYKSEWESAVKVMALGRGTISGDDKGSGLSGEAAELLGVGVLVVLVVLIGW